MIAPRTSPIEFACLVMALICFGLIFFEVTL